MTENPNEAVQRDLDAIRRGFEAHLGERIGEVAGAWEAVTRSSDKISATRDVAQLAHSLAGTSSVLGLIDVGRAAAALEEALEQVPNGGLPSGVDSALEKLINVGAEAARQANEP